MKEVFLKDSIYYCKWNGKRCFTKAEGNVQVRMFKATGSKRSKCPTRLYYCKYCDMYHLSHLRSKKKSVRRCMY